ncbi:Methionine gamma-lyase [Anaerococcus prevotii]|uniref:O-succinylhomoserine sulfhydrylase n=1 Tax=Anaerococcus prevotii (strain ATCC 9321 / DSM 20548 / JCM 6508 / NCTC 11806 / PC1) TaxID=525919 RepID=C7RFS1_ANAPD|nr:O-acetylhomoserine aminocarboxypropyltransferase/cysteine synthase family protein [Anaerococcus prevotii]ACV28332.1 O-acetylhomoserine/O-acetylserine sulfhydrylase [Anaerococcus prevotii DSM 20548]SUU93887.1 Methionine gamma-lyase [Anaerococcus prevotii]
MSKYKNIDTACVRAGYEAKNGDSSIPPIVQSTTFSYEKTSEIADLFDLKESGFFYTRLGNPTIDALEKKIADLDGGVCAVGTGSGQAANLLAVLNIAKAGDNIVAVNNIYGGTYNLFANTLRDLGIETKFVNNNDLDELRAAIDDNTKLVFGETISNPKASVLDIKSYADIAHEHNIPLILDNTLATPALLRPIDYGCDIVTYSSSKYIDGHAAALGGLIVDSGNFDWESGDFDRLTKPDESYHGLIFTEQFKNAAYGARLRTVGLRDFGAVISPQNAFLTILGLDTLALRMNKHSENALRVAEFLEDSDKVDSVSYPFLESSPSYPYAKKYLKGGSGVVSFEIKGGRDEASKFIDSLNLITLAVHVADVRSLALHPASSTHRQLSDEELEKVGVSKSLIRLSIGIEDADDLIEDISQALDKAVRR